LHFRGVRSRFSSKPCIILGLGHANLTKISLLAIITVSKITILGVVHDMPPEFGCTLLIEKTDAELLYLWR
jgi:hypothetical protein